MGTFLLGVLVGAILAGVVGLFLILGFLNDIFKNL